MVGRTGDASGGADEAVRDIGGVEAVGAASVAAAATSGAGDAAGDAVNGPDGGVADDAETAFAAGAKVSGLAVVESTVEFGVTIGPRTPEGASAVGTVPPGMGAPVVTPSGRASLGDGVDAGRVAGREISAVVRDVLPVDAARSWLLPVGAGARPAGGGPAGVAAAGTAAGTALCEATGSGVPMSRRCTGVAASLGVGVATRPSPAAVAREVGDSEVPPGVAPTIDPVPLFGSTTGPNRAAGLMVDAPPGSFPGDSSTLFAGAGAVWPESLGAVLAAGVATLGVGSGVPALRRWTGAGAVASLLDVGVGEAGAAALSFGSTIAPSRPSVGIVWPSRASVPAGGAVIAVGEVAGR